MTSRLDRLFILLESGSSTVTRRAAAQQIGEVQKLYPNELHRLLNRLIVYLHSNCWDTRIAAAQAVDAILKNVPEWHPPELARRSERGGGGGGGEVEVVEEEDDNSSSSRHSGVSSIASTSTGGKEVYLTFADFNLEQVLKRGILLFGSEGVEFDVTEERSDVGSAEQAADSCERLNRQRALLNAKLGLTQASKLGINLTHLITNEDVEQHPTTTGGATGGKSESPSSSSSTSLQMSTTLVVSEEEGGKNIPVEHLLNLPTTSRRSQTHQKSQTKCLSSREMNRARRKARQNAASALLPVPSTSNGSGAVMEEPERKKMKADATAAAAAAAASGQTQTDVFYSLKDAVPDLTGKWVEDAVNWPLANFCNCLYMDLFNPKWEIRHGAATALRELIKQHGSGGGRNAHHQMTPEEMENSHNAWLEDGALRLICVLALDRFGDFVSDQVIAPVRETCAQVLGTIVKEMTISQVCQVVEMLRLLMKQEDWEVRHGALLGFKYIFVVRQELLPMYLPKTIDHVIMSLFDAVEDVGAVAAETLIPIASHLRRLLAAHQVSSIVTILWDLLLDQDELSSTCNSFMSLLAAILSLPNICNWIKMESLVVLIPRLWPFLSHNSSLVRKSTLTTIKTLTSPLTRDDRDDRDEEEQVEEEEKEEANNNNNNNTPECDALSPSHPARRRRTRRSGGDEKKSLKLIFSVSDWPKELLQDALRHIFQRILCEPKQEIQQLAQDVWENLVSNADLGSLLHAACPYMSGWMCLAMQPIRLPFENSVLVKVADNGINPKLFLGGNESTPVEIREQNGIRARVKATKVLGLLSKYLIMEAPGVEYGINDNPPIECYTNVLMSYLNSRSAIQRIVCGLTIAFWAQNYSGGGDEGGDCCCPPRPKKLIDKLHFCLLENVYYDEVAASFTRLLQEAQDLILTLKEYKVCVANLDKSVVLTLLQIEDLITNVASRNNLLKYNNLKKNTLEMLEERRQSLNCSLERTICEQRSYNISTQAALAGAIVSMRCLPTTKLNPIVKPLMESIKCEDCPQLQQLSAEFLVQLMEQVYERQPSPNSKILNNLCMLLKSDSQFTPKITPNNEAPLVSLAETPEVDTVEESKGNPYYGILSLHKRDSSVNTSIALGRMDAEMVAVAGVAGPSPHRGPGRPPSSSSSSSTSQTSPLSNNNPTSRETSAAADLERKCERIQRLGASRAIIQLCCSLGNELVDKIPVFEELCSKRIHNYVEQFPEMQGLYEKVIEMDRCEDLITSLQLVEIAATSLHPGLQELLFALLNPLGTLIAHPFKAIRHLALRCLASLAEVDVQRTMTFVVHQVLPSLRCMERVVKRQGAVEAVDQLVNRLQIKVVPYIVMLVVPLLGCVSDPNECIRLLATRCFANLIQLMPLDVNHSPGSLTIIKDEALLKRKQRDFQFLEYLLTPNSIPDYELPIPLSVKLRSYQQAGLNWLWFLNKYNLHGILCDDMGLGKTLQTICIMAADHQERVINRETELCSLVICPTTLTGHWICEMEKFLGKHSNVLRPLHYVGCPVIRETLRESLGNFSEYNVVVTSYDTIRKDLEYLRRINWNYCVLDEGHIIKNGKTKSSKAIKQLRAAHRLILSGTPIQNNVLELWSLFDFLMPGFLGTEKQFAIRYSKPILAARDAKSSLKEQEAGVLAMEALHKQVLPFLMRRMKEDVLDDLPPKIIQDLMCDLSGLQKRLYEDFSRLHLDNVELDQHLEDTLHSRSSSSSSSSSSTHIFHALRYLQNVCNHPKLVLNNRHPEFESIRSELAEQNSSLDDIEHSAKLLVLKQLLLDCGIGVPLESVGQHRALIFCQLKSMLNIVEKDLLSKHLPTVSYLRLDGSVPAAVRQNIVQNFNSDPSIDVLLLTTQVGGLGLTLTGADTVIFVEHDWNPMKDLQAMDRAHRIGQKKVVNVYRLITRQSLEEKIMGLQKFKLLTANTVVSNENASLETMATSQLFDLFQAEQTKTMTVEGGGEVPEADRSGSSQQQQHPLSMKSALENLPELWSAEQYDEEYDVTNYLEMIRRKD